jgi:hypothetical protein
LVALLILVAGCSPLTDAKDLLGRLGRRRGGRSEHAQSHGDDKRASRTLRRPVERPTVPRHAYSVKRCAGSAYVEGQNIAYEARFAERKLERLPDLAAELVRLKVDVIVAQGGASTEAARRATSTIPIVMAPASGMRWRSDGSRPLRAQARTSPD